MAAATGGQYYETKVIAQLFNVSVRRIQQLTQDGVLETVKIPDGGRRYELVPTIQAYTKIPLRQGIREEQPPRKRRSFASRS